MKRKIILVGINSDMATFEQVASADIVLAEDASGWHAVKTRNDHPTNYEIIATQERRRYDPHEGITLEIPPGITMGDIMTVEGALVDVATGFVDWAKLYNHETDAISSPGVFLMTIIKALKDYAS